MNDQLQQSEAPPIETPEQEPIVAQPQIDPNDPDTPAIDVIISQFDTALNELRQHAAKLPQGATARAINDVLHGYTAIQAFMREMRRLLGDII